MKKITLIIIAAMIVSGAAAFIIHKSKQATPTQTVQANPVWFNTIEIAKGITVEFEYGPQLQVFVEGDKELITQLAVVLENQVLKATGKNQCTPVSGVRIKVVTPVLINLALEHNPAAKGLKQCTGMATSTNVVVEPVLTRQQLFQVYILNA
jgi:hypothetical protein